MHGKVLFGTILYTKILVLRLLYAVYLHLGTTVIFTVIYRITCAKNM